LLNPKIQHQGNKMEQYSNIRPPSPLYDPERVIVTPSENDGSDLDNQELDEEFPIIDLEPPPEPW